MSVMECNRKGCDEIMCDEYSELTGYLCYSCLQDLRNFEPKSENDVKKFMKTEKVNYSYYDEDYKFSIDRLFGKDV